MLRPQYLEDAGKLGPAPVRPPPPPRQDDPINPVIEKRNVTGDEQINPKLKQFYEVRTKIKQFYTGGKISVMNDQYFICQCGSSIKVMGTAGKIKKDKLEVEVDDSTSKTLGLTEAENSENDSKQDFKSLFSFIRELETDLDEIIAFDACPASNILITSHKSNLLRIWCLLTGEVIKTVKSLHHLPIGFIEIHKTKALQDVEQAVRQIEKSDGSISDFQQAVEVSRGDLCWATVSGSGVKLWEVGGNTMSRLVKIENVASLGYVRWSSAKYKKQLFVAERNIYVMGIVPERKQFDIIHTLEGHYSQVTGIEFGENDLMVSGGRDKVIILWDMKNSFNKIKTIAFNNPIEGLLLATISDLYVAVSPSEIRHFDLKTQSLSKSPVLTLNEDETITGFHSPIAPKEKTLDNFLVSTHTSAIYEVSLSKPEPGLRKTVSINRQYIGSLDEILSAVLWVEDKVAVANNTNVIKLYAMKSGSCEFLRGHKDIVLSLSTHKEWLVSGAKDNKVIFWKATSLEPQVILEGHLASVTSVCFSPCNVVAYSVSEDNFLKAWDQTKCLRSAVAHDKEINSVHCSQNGVYVVTASRDKTAKVWDAESLSVVGTFKGHKKGVWDAKFSSWDQLVATSSADTTIKIWSLTSFACVQTLQGHLSSVLQSQFINSGLQIVSVSSDGSMKTWELKTSACLTTEECGNDKIWTLDASPDGSVIVTGSADSTLIVWHDITEQKVNESIAKRKKLIEDEQLLNNIMSKGKWTDAFLLALDLGRPFTLLKVIREVSDVKEFKPFIKNLKTEQKVQLFDYITQWNTNTKTSTEAQILLSIILETIHPKELGHLQPVQLLSYTEKHLQRLKRMQMQMAMLDFIANES